VIDIARISFKPASLGYEAGVIGAALLGRATSVGNVSTGAVEQGSWS
jgi:hypothetical protein